MKKNWVCGVEDDSFGNLALTRCTWKERNCRVFEGKDLWLQDFKLYFSESCIVGVVHLVVEETFVFRIL